MKDLNAEDCGKLGGLFAGAAITGATVGWIIGGTINLFRSYSAADIFTWKVSSYDNFMCYLSSEAGKGAFFGAIGGMLLILMIGGWALYQADKNISNNSDNSFPEPISQDPNYGIGTS